MEETALYLEQMSEQSRAIQKTVHITEAGACMQRTPVVANEHIARLEPHMFCPRGDIQCLTKGLGKAQVGIIFADNVVDSPADGSILTKNRRWRTDRWSGLRLKNLRNFPAPDTLVQPINSVKTQSFQCDSMASS